MAPKQQAQSNGPRERILRIGIILGGKIVEERLIRDRETVTIGQSAKNTFSIPAPELPKSWPLFSSQQNKYSLHFGEGMDGRISDGGGVLALAQLKQGQAQKLADRYVLPLSDQARGKIILGDMTILFQFVMAPPLQPRPQLPQSVRGRLLDRVDPYMAAILLFSLIVHGGVVGFIYSMDTPRKPEPDEIPDRYATVLTQKPPEPEPVVAPPTEGPAKEEPKAGGGEDKKPPKDPGEKKPAPEPSGDDGGGDAEAKAKEEAEARGVINIVGSRGKGAGRFADVSDGKNPGGDLQAGIDKARREGTGVSAAGGTGGGTRGSSTGSVGTGSGPGVAGPKGSGNDGKGVKVGEEQVKVTGSVGKPVIDDDGGLDAESVYQKIKTSYYGQVQKCYQDALKSNSSLKGRVDVTITIGPAGSVTSVDVDGFDSGVDACIQQNARRWRFNKPPNGSATFQFPFTFRSGG
jgi:TonB family protein